MRSESMSLLPLLLCPTLAAPAWPQELPAANGTRLVVFAELRASAFDGQTPADTKRSVETVLKGFGLDASAYLDNDSIGSVDLVLEPDNQRLSDFWRGVGFGIDPMLEEARRRRTAGMLERDGAEVASVEEGADGSLRVDFTEPVYQARLSEIFARVGKHAVRDGLDPSRRGAIWVDIPVADFEEGLGVAELLARDPGWFAATELKQAPAGAPSWSSPETTGS